MRTLRREASVGRFVQCPELMYAPSLHPLLHALLRRRLFPALTLLLAAAAPLAAQSPDTDPPAQRHVLGSSLFMMMNLAPDPPSFFQLNYGYRLSAKTTVSLEAITWRYTAPLGIPWGPSFGDEAEEYPGRVRGIGVGVAYQRLLWRGL